VHVVDVVTPPAVTRKVLEALDPASVDAVWLQDGSFDDEVLAYASARFPVLVHHACIMVVTARL
jgi:predicted CoA-binding protein